MAAAVGVHSGSSFSFGSLHDPRTRVSHFIIDARFDAARDIARLTAQPGARLLPLPRDVLALWHDELLPALGSTAQAVAGVTTEYAFFTLRTLASDQRLRARIVAKHAPRGAFRNEALVSWVIDPAISRS